METIGFFVGTAHSLNILEAGFGFLKALEEQMKAFIFLGVPFLCLATIQGVAQSSTGNLPPDQHSTVQAPTSSAQQNQPLQRFNLSTFSGRIAKDSDGRLFLVEANSELKYLLDDQKQAAKYLHKPVIIEGSLVPPGNVLHVQKIERVR